MRTFDAGLYLRMVGERTLLTQNSSLGAVARALVAAGAITAESAEVICDDYSFALQLRRRNPVWGGKARAADASADSEPSLRPPRIVTCARTLHLPWGELFVHYVVLGDESTTMAATALTLWSKPPRQAFHETLRPPEAGPPRPPQLTFEDDQATTEVAVFSLTQSVDQVWHGEFWTRRPLARDTAWIEVDGQRLDLTGESPAVEVWIEAVAEDLDAAHRHLWRCVATGGGPGVLEPAIGALVAAGAIAADDPDLSQARFVADELLQTFLGGVPGRDLPGLPEPWRSLLASRGRGGGPVGPLPVGATTPVFDGITVSVVGLKSGDQDFQVDARMIGPVALGPFSDAALDRTTVTWRAQDERGNHFLGILGNGSGRPGVLRTQVRFWPALDPQATWLDVLVTATTSRAVIRIPLAWASP